MGSLESFQLGPRSIGLQMEHCSQLRGLRSLSMVELVPGCPDDMGIGTTSIGSVSALTVQGARELRSSWDYHCLVRLLVEDDLKNQLFPQTVPNV